MMPTLETERLILRPFRREDAGAVATLAGNWEVARMLSRVPHPYPLEMAEEWIASHGRLRETGAEYVFCIEHDGAVAGSIGAAIAGARELNPKLPVEIEVEDSEQLVTAIEAGADIIMLDNFSVQQMIAAVAVTDRRAKLEASGGIKIDTIRDFAESGVDFISVGALTKNVRAVDLSMRFSAIGDA